MMTHGDSVALQLDAVSSCQYYAMPQEYDGPARNHVHGAQGCHAI